MLLLLYLGGEAEFMALTVLSSVLALKLHSFSFETSHMLERHESSVISYSTEVCQWMTYCWFWCKCRSSNRVLPQRNEAAIPQRKDMMNPSHPLHDLHSYETEKIFPPPGQSMSSCPFYALQSLTFDSDKLEV